jgi:hypothetical protein
MHGPSSVATWNSALPLPRSVKSGGNFLAELANASVEQSSGSRSTGSARLEASEQDYAGRNEIGQQEAQAHPAQSIPAESKASANATEVAATSDREKAPEKPASKTVEDCYARGGRASEPSTKNAVPLNVQSTTAASNTQAQLLASQLAQDNSANSCPVTPLKQFYQTAQVAADAEAVAASDREKVQEKPTSKTLVDCSVPSNGQSESSAKIAVPLNVQSTTAAPDTQAQSLAYPLAQDSSANSCPATPLKQFNETAEVVPSGDREKVPEALASKTPADCSVPASAPSESSTTNAAPLNVPSTVAVQSTGAAPGTQAQPITSHLTQDSSATLRPATPLKQLNATAPFAAAIDGGPTEAIVSNGMQVPSGAVQADAEMVQAFVEVPLSIPVQGNMAGLAESGASGNPIAGRTVSKQSSDTPAFKDPNLANATDVLINQSASTVAGSHDPSAQGGRSSSQSSQNAPTDASQTVSAMPRVADSSFAQVQAQTIMPAVPAHESTPNPHPASVLAESSPAPDRPAASGFMQSEMGGAVATSGISSAKLIQAMSGTEMRVGMHSGEFGDISIRASVSQQQMLARISLDHGELSQALSAHTTSLQKSLGEAFGLHASIEINDHGSTMSGGSEQSSHKQSGTAGPARGNSAADPAAAEKGISPEILVGAGEGHRLDIRA